ALPYDVVHEIISRCSSLPTLASIALINSIFNKEAEHFLYRKIRLTTRMGAHRVLCCTATLASAPAKAALVRSFSAFTGSDFLSTGENKILVQTLCDALVNMKGLQHLWLRACAKSKAIETTFL
ncbi:hypothetical protein H0H81_001950, partial [Sphagnurus paluster]